MNEPRDYHKRNKLDRRRQVACDITCMCPIHMLLAHAGKHCLGLVFPSGNDACPSNRPNTFWVGYILT